MDLSLFWLSLAFLAIVALSTIETGFLVRFFTAKKIFSKVHQGSSHTRPTPSAGGIGACDALLAAGFFWLWLGPEPLPGIVSWSLWFGMALLACVSLIDDLRPLPVGLRLLVQSVVVLWMLPQLPDGIVPLPVPLWVSLVLIFIYWLSMVNFVNFIDGADGITYSALIPIGLAIGMVTWFWDDGLRFLSTGLPALACAAAMLGFAFWNRPPARIFLGDVGSIPIGFLTAGLLLQLAGLGFPEAAFLLSLYYALDAGLAVAGKMVQGEKFWEPHKRFFYKRALENGRSHGELARAVGLAHMVLAALAVASPALPLWLVVPAGLAVAGALIFWMLSKPKS